MKKLLLLIVLMIAGYLAWKWWRNSDGGQKTSIYDRVWLDHMPKSESDTFQGFGVLTHEPVGWFALRTVWKGEWEMFRHEPRGDGQLEMFFPYSKTKQRVTYRAWKCSEPHFDYCLEISAGRGARKYYSRRGWEVHSAADERALDEKLAHGD